MLAGPVVDRSVTGWISRLESRFNNYLNVYPYGLWAPGLAVEHQMRVLTEFLLPLEEIRSAIRALCRAVLVPRLPDIPLFHSARFWLDIVPRLPIPLRMVNPSRLLKLLVDDERHRIEFIFALHLPNRYGGGFRRYPCQLEFLRRWLAARRAEAHGPLHCLDAACGSGEGTYDVGILLLEAGFRPDAFTLHGVSLDPLEIFAAAHGYFPNDDERQRAFRSEIAPLFQKGGEKAMKFYIGDMAAPCAGTGSYDLILCNGLLGGPLLHDEEELRLATKSLADRLKPGGIMLVADRFHGGWGKKTPKERLIRLFLSHGLALTEIEEGIAVTKKRPPERPPSL